MKAKRWALQNKLRIFFVFVILLGGLLSTFLLSSCKKHSEGTERSNKHFQNAFALLRIGKKEKALETFLKVVEEEAFAPESTLEISQILIKEKRDFIGALFYLNKASHYIPPLYKQRFNALFKAAQRELYFQMATQVSPDAKERTRLLEQIHRLKEDNRKLQLELKKIQRNQRILAPKSASPQESNICTYTIQAGDTLSKISQKVYNNPNAWGKIYEANRDQLTSPTALQVGQVLEIP